MQRYSFTIEVTGLDSGAPQFEDVFFRAGCDDALVAVIDGRILLEFDREAPTYEVAIDSASRDLERAGATVVGVSPLAN